MRINNPKAIKKASPRCLVSAPASVSAGLAGAGGAAGDQRERVSRGAAAGCSVASGAEGVGESLGYQAGDGGVGGEEVGEEMREPGLPTV